MRRWRGMADGRTPNAPGVMVLAVTLMLLATACDHSTPFGPVPSEMGLLPEQPTRMTYSPGIDRLGGFTAAGEELFYTYCEDNKVELNPPCGEVHQPGLPAGPGDVCLGALPGSGGGRVVERCGTGSRDADSLKQLLGGTRLDDGSLVYIYATRRTTASFSVNPALYLLRRGAHSPIKLFEYRPAIDDLGIPTRLLAAGGQRLVTLGGDGPELVTIHDDNTATRGVLDGVEAVDPAAPLGARIVDGMVKGIDLLTGASSDLMLVPASGVWEGAQPTALAMAGASVVVAQSLNIGSDVQSRVVLLREGAPPHEVTFQAGAAFTRLAVSPDERILVVELGGDLFRYALP